MAKVNISNPDEYEEKKKPEIKSVVKGAVTAKDKSLGRKIRGLFLSRDLNELKSYIVEDIVIPGAIKAAHGAVDIAFDRDVRSYSTSKRGNSVIRYDRASEGHSRRGDSEHMKQKRDFRELIFESRGDAEEVLSNLVDLITDYEKASIADLYDLCEITSAFTDNKYGWTDLSDASVRRVSEGYILDLPRAEQL